MDSEEVDDCSVARRVRICRPAFQDMHHLVMPRLAARAQLRRHAMKLRFWKRGDACAADLECFELSGEGLFAVHITDGYGLADGYYVVFCELPFPEPSGMLCVLSVMRNDEPFTAVTLDILRGREVIARERLRGLD